MRYQLVGLTLALGILASCQPRGVAERQVITSSNNPDLVTVTITAPTSSATYDAGSADTLTTLAGTATSAPGITGCRWENNQGGLSGAATGTATPSVGSIALTVGVNTITLSCTNAIGITGTDTLAVTRSSGSCTYTDGVTGLGACFPGPENTGTSGSLTASGSITTTSNGQIIENLHVTGSITVLHANVIIRNVRVTGSGGVSIGNAAGGSSSSYTLEDCELDGTGNIGAQSSNDFYSITMRRCEVVNYGEGPGCAGTGPHLLEDNYMHGFSDFSSGGAHQDAIQCEFGSNVTIRHNTLLMDSPGGSSAVQIGDQVGNSNNLIEKNLVGGGGYTLSIGGVITASDNRFSSTLLGFAGQIGAFGGSVTQCGNRWWDGVNAEQFISGNSAC